MSGLRDVVVDLRGLAEVLDSARRYGLPMPYDVGLTGYNAPRLLVHTAEEWQQWADYLEAPTFKLSSTETADHLSLTGSDYEFEVTVTTLVPVGEGVRHMPEAAVTP